MDTLKEELKKALIEALNLEDLTSNDIEDDKPLFADDGLGLDSIDALEIILILERNYGIRIADPKEGKAIFYSINTLADYVEKNRKK
jgi:acyl carrier protein